MPTLSIVIFRSTIIATLLEQVVMVPTEKLGFTREILVVNDGSKSSSSATFVRWVAWCSTFPRKERQEPRDSLTRGFTQLDYDIAQLNGAETPLFQPVQAD